jgi:PTS system galactitol-specific IIC component
MYFTIWVANKTIPWITKMAVATNSINEGTQISALDQGGCPITYVYAELFSETKDMIALIAVAAIYIFCWFFAVKVSRQRQAAIKAAEAKTVS